MTQEEFAKRYNFSVRTDKIGGGSFGTVYRAYDNVRDRHVAIKVSETKMHGEKEFSLTQEFEAIKDLAEHTNLAFYEKVYSFETFQGVFDYAIMQYYADGNLSEYLKNNTLNDSEKEQLIFQILEGIEHLHKNSVVHRDLKPSNILIVDRNGVIIPKITDFGLSKKAEQKGAQFTNSFAGGTLQYSSPEQLKGKPLKLNTDIWSFGCIAYEILMDVPLFESKNNTASAEAEKQLIEDILKGNHSEKLEKSPTKWKNVLKYCLTIDSEKRASGLGEIRNSYFDGNTTINAGKTISKNVKETYESSNDNTLVFESKKVRTDEVFKVKNETVRPREKTTTSFLFIGIIIFLLLGIAGYFGWGFYQKKQEEVAWQLAETRNKTQSYSSYLENYPNGNYKQIAVEKYDWLKLKSNLSVKSLSSFSVNHPTTIFKDSLKYFSELVSSEKIMISENTTDVTALTKIDDGYLIGVKIWLDVNQRFEGGESNSKLIKLDEAKNIVWQKDFDFNWSEKITQIISSNNDSYILIINSDNKRNTYKGQSLVLKINKKGELLWKNSFGKNFYDDIETIKKTKDNGYILLGQNFSKGTFNPRMKSRWSDVWVVRINNNGDFLWDKTYGKEDGDSGVDIVELENGDFIILSDYYTKKSNGLFGGKLRLIKIDKNGVLLKEKTFLDNNFNSYGNSMFFKDGNQVKLLNGVLWGNEDYGDMDFLGFNFDLNKVFEKRVQIDRKSSFTHYATTSNYIHHENGDLEFVLNRQYRDSSNYKNFSTGKREMQLIRLDSTGGKINDTIFGPSHKISSFISKSNNSGLLMLGIERKNGSEITTKKGFWAKTLDKNRE